MYQKERQTKLLEYINAEGKASVEELSSRFETSKVTIRNDISELSASGYLIRTHGGALSITQRLNCEIPYNQKETKNIAIKERIGEAAAKMIEDNDVIIVDAGSTTYQIVRKITGQNITLITNDLKIAYEAAHMNNIKLIVTGGEQEKTVFTLLGSETEKFFDRIRVNKLFLGCDAIDVDFGITNTITGECSVKQKMITSAREIIAVADSSKFNNQQFIKICDIEEIDVLITDSLSDVNNSILQRKGVRVLQV